MNFTVGISPTLGIRGIIATYGFKTGDIVEKCPVILIPKSEWPALMNTVLKKYYYEWTSTHHAIVLGYGSRINHSYTPNAKYVFDFKNKFLVYKAIIPIQTGSEITVNYNWDPTSKTPVDSFLVDFNQHHI